MGERADNPVAGVAPRTQSKMTRVKNKSAANVQITAEQLLREAQERQLEHVAPTPRQKITDPEGIVFLMPPTVWFVVGAF